MRSLNHAQFAFLFWQQVKALEELKTQHSRRKSCFSKKYIKTNKQVKLKRGIIQLRQGPFLKKGRTKVQSISLLTICWKKGYFLFICNMMVNKSWFSPTCLISDTLLVMSLERQKSSIFGTLSLNDIYQSLYVPRDILYKYHPFAPPMTHNQLSVGFLRHVSQRSLELEGRCNIIKRETIITIRFCYTWTPGSSSWCDKKLAKLLSTHLLSKVANMLVAWHGGCILHSKTIIIACTMIGHIFM